MCKKGLLDVITLRCFSGFNESIGKIFHDKPMFLRISCFLKSSYAYASYSALQNLLRILMPKTPEIWKIDILEDAHGYLAICSKVTRIMGKNMFFILLILYLFSMIVVRVKVRTLVQNSYNKNVQAKRTIRSAWSDVQNTQTFKLHPISWHSTKSAYGLVI